MNERNYLPDTESRNSASADIDALDTAEMLAVINSEDKKIAGAVEKEIPSVARAVDAAEQTIRRGGRVIYLGCGTSGRLGVLDASECPPTYSVPDDWFMGIIAGGFGALVKSSEGAEDFPEQGAEDLKAVNFSKSDMVIGIAASGRTPYVIGGLEYAGSLGSVTACVVCSKGSPMAAVSQIAIEADVGPEVVTGSTRMKSGTAQKMILNMISTGAMIRLGKVYGNLMVDLKPSNSKLVSRAGRIISEIAGCDGETAGRMLEASGNNVKAAVIMIKFKCDLASALNILERNSGLLKKSLKDTGGREVMIQ